MINLKLKYLTPIIFIVFLIGCGSGDKSKQVRVDASFKGPDAEAFGKLVEITDNMATFTIEKTKKEDSGNPLDEQKWTATVCCRSASDVFKGLSINEIVSALEQCDITLSVVDKSGQIITALSGFKMEGENLRSFANMLHKGAGADWYMIFTLQTFNSAECDLWFDRAYRMIIYVKGL